MKKRFLCILFCLGTMAMAFCQNDSLEQAILAYENKQLTLVGNGRAMLLESFMANDQQKTASLLHYLETQVENEDYLALYNFEKWFLYLWTGQYQKVLQPFRNITEPSAIFAYRPGISPPDDLLAEKLIRQTDQEYTALLKKLDETGMVPADKEFLKLFVGWLLLEGKATAVNADQLSKASNEYLGRFPDSDFHYFVSHYVNQEVKLAKRGMDFEFFSGYGFYTKGLDDHFGHHIPLGVAFDFYYKKWIFGFRDHIGIGKLDQDIVFDEGTWEKGRSFNHFLIELSGAYEVFDNHRFKLFPFGGVTFTTISPVEADVKKYPIYDDLGLDWHPVPVAGLNLDIKLNSPYSPNPQLRNSYGFLRVRAGFCPTRFDRKQPEMNGNSFFLTLGFGGVARQVVKKYDY